jgi:hypothetical protein
MSPYFQDPRVSVAVMLAYLPEARKEKTYGILELVSAGEGNRKPVDSM